MTSLEARGDGKRAESLGGAAHSPRKAFRIELAVGPPPTAPVACLCQALCRCDLLCLKRYGGICSETVEGGHLCPRVSRK